eukprot:5429555-Prymnesium_polylepis.1
MLPAPPPVAAPPQCCRCRRAAAASRSSRMSSPRSTSPSPRAAGRTRSARAPRGPPVWRWPAPSGPPP